METLPGRDYHAADVFDVERERVFARNWYYAGRAEALAGPGDFVTVDVAGESVIVLRAKDGALHGFYNVCRHRGSRLCDEASGRMNGAVKCPYHAWSYAFDGRLIGTPNVGTCTSTPARLRSRAGSETSTTRRSASPASISARFASATSP
jgi:Rieske 2Fe-2S family protein